LDPIRLPLASVVIGFVERLTLLFDNADLPIGNDTRMTGPMSAKAELADLKSTQKKCEGLGGPTVSPDE
jgi:hypothetical protein